MSVELLAGVSCVSEGAMASVENFQVVETEIPT